MKTSAIKYQIQFNHKDLKSKFVLFNCTKMLIRLVLKVSYLRMTFRCLQFSKKPTQKFDKFLP